MRFLENADPASIRHTLAALERREPVHFETSRRKTKCAQITAKELAAEINGESGGAAEGVVLIVVR